MEEAVVPEGEVIPYSGLASALIDPEYFCRTQDTEILVDGSSAALGGLSSMPRVRTEPALSKRDAVPAFLQQRGQAAGGKSCGGGIKVADQAERAPALQEAVPVDVPCASAVAAAVPAASSVAPSVSAASTDLWLPTAVATSSFRLFARQSALDPLLFMRAPRPDSLEHTPPDAESSSEVVDSSKQVAIASADDAESVSRLRGLLRKAKSRLKGSSKAVLSYLHVDASGKAGEPDWQSLADARYFELPEDEGTHERWSAALAGRAAEDVPEDELRWLVDTGTPLNKRHTLWPRWWAKPACPQSIDAMQKEVSVEAAKLILCDLMRTLPGLLSDEDLNVLRRVLYAYATLHPENGYCQGMSFLAALPIFLGFGERDAFACLRYVCEDVCPGYHGPHLEGYLRDLAVLSALVSCMLPEVYVQLEEHQVSMHMIATDHLLTLHVRTWPLVAVVRLWDVVLMEGSPALLASFLATLELYFSRAIARVASRATDGEVDATDAALEFRELVRLSVANEIDEVVHSTRRFIPLVRGEPLGAGGHCLGTAAAAASDSDDGGGASASGEAAGNLASVTGGSRAPIPRGAGAFLDWFRSEVGVTSDTAM